MTTLSQVFDEDEMQKISSEFTRLRDRCYLENAGAALYPKSLLGYINDDLLNNVYLNPHTDKYTANCIEQIRCLILKHFNTDPSLYTVIFTSGSTQSLKLVVESFQFTDDNELDNSGTFMYLQDNHTSVIGLREIADDKSADIVHISHDDFLQSIETFKPPFTSNWRERKRNEGNNLLVYPAQSNFNGFKYPIDCISNIKKGCLNSHLRKHLCTLNNNWYVLLDAASYVATNKLDLSITQPDFICLSFYKIFGYPTGLGALLVKNSSSDVLNKKRYFGGGTVDVVISSEDFHVKRDNLHERFEDGTVPFLSILSLKHCFDTMHKIIPKVVNNDLMDSISYHTYALAKDLYEQLKKLSHPNGAKAVIFYMDSNFDYIKEQAGMVTFNLLREDGSYIGYAEFQHMADLFNINIRTGCFCNSGSCQRHLKFTNNEIKDIYKAGHKCGDEVDLVNGKPTGAVRASFGYYNTFQDVDKLVIMVCRCFVKTNYNRPTRIMKKFNDIELPKQNFIRQYSNEKYKIGQDETIPFYENIDQQFDSKIVLTEIAVFPIKSCGAFKIQSGWNIGSKGFEYDREWMIIKDNGVCLTQKQSSRMCMIKPKIDVKQGKLILNFKGKSPISISLDPALENKNRDASFCHSKVCADIVKGYDCGDEVADWISEALEISFLRLIRQSTNDKRVQKKKEGERKFLSLSNQAQFLLVNKATVRWLRDKIQDPLFTDTVECLVDRFRGNLVIDMEEALVEKEWQKLVIGKHEFKVEGQCNRCQMICIDQQSGDKTVEPLRTISEQFEGKMRFGIYLTYIGTVDASEDFMLENYSAVKPTIGTVSNISR